MSQVCQFTLLFALQLLTEEVEHNGDFENGHQELSEEVSTLGCTWQFSYQDTC